MVPLPGRLPALAIPAALLAGILAGLVAGACGAPPAPSGSPVLGSVRVSVQRVAGGQEFFASEHHARLVDPAGRVVGEWKLSADGAAPAQAPIGSYTLSAFTVFLSDFLQCTPDPVRPGLQTCFQPTLGPAQVCSVPIELTATLSVEARFSILAGGRCGLELVPPPVPLWID